MSVKLKKIIYWVLTSLIAFVFVGSAFGFEIYLVWDKAQIYTDIDIYMKENATSVAEFARKIKNIPA